MYLHTADLNNFATERDATLKPQAVVISLASVVYIKSILLVLGDATEG